MSDQSQGPGWWLASDSTWYAPELHPDFVPTAPVSGPPGIAPPLPRTATVPLVAPSNPQTSDEIAIGGTSQQRDSSHASRHWWVWAAPIVAGGMALAIVLTLTVGGTAKTTLATGRPSAGKKSLTGSYVGTATGPEPLLLTLLQSGTSLRGTLTSVGPTASSPERLTNTSIALTGTVNGSAVTLVPKIAGEQTPAMGSISGTTLTVDFAPGLTVVFTRGTLAQFDQLVSHDRESLLAQGDLLADRAAESNLTNAITEAKALYQVDQAYSSEGRPYGVHALSMQAPEFAWTTGPCSEATQNCISVQVLDVGADHDSQGIALSTLSRLSSTCWYDVDLESSPRVVPNDHTAFLSMVRGPNASVTTAGVYYARSPAGATPTSCTASLVLHAHRASWGSSYTGAGAMS
jgi:hypothetical protein